MQVTELERLARIEEQVLGVRDDIGRMEVSLATATKIFADLHVSYVPRTEVNEMRQARDKDEEEQNKQIAELWKKRNDDREEIERLHRKWAWLAGIGSASMIALGLLEAWLRGGVKG